MKIWIIGRGYPTAANKMWGVFELEQAKLLARHGYEVTYIALTLSFMSRQDPRGMRVFDEDGVTVIAYSHFYFPGKLGVYLEGFEDGCWRKLFAEAEHRGGRPDIIHVHYPAMLSSINVTEEYRKKGVRIFATEHWSRVLIDNLKPHELRRLKYYAAHVSCLASVGEPLQKAIAQLVDVTVPTAIIPNIVSPVFFSIAPPKSTAGFTFITVGRLVSLKQFDQIIAQFMEQFEGNADVHLKLIGNGPERKMLEALARDDKRIAFLGELPLREVAREIASANVLVSFSQYETFAAPVAEAWACGKPAIVSRQSGISSYVNDALGIVVSGDSPETLGKAMKTMHDHYGRYSPDEIAAFANERFSDKAVFRMLSEMYRSN